MSDVSFLYEDGFNTDEAAENAGDGEFKPIPKGWYRCQIFSAETEETKAGNGLMVVVRLDVEGPQHAGRVIFDRILVKHPSEKAREIGRERYATLARGCGLVNPQNTDEFLGKTVEAFVKIEKSEEYGDRNAVTLYRPPAQSGGLNVEGKASTGLNKSDDDLPF